MPTATVDAEPDTEPAAKPDAGLDVDLDNRVVAVAVRTARYAARLGLPLTSCPYRGPDADQAALRRVWIVSYLRERPPTAGREVAAKPADEPADEEAQQIQAAWLAAVAALLAAWPSLSLPMIAMLLEQLGGIEVGNIAALAALTVSGEVVAAIAEALTTAMTDLAGAAAAQVVADAQAAGAPVGPVEPDRTELAAIATVTASLLATGYATAAARTALRGDVDQVRQVLDAMSSAVSGTVADHLRSALAAAQNFGRAAAFRLYPPLALVANETLDKSTCGPCAKISGTRFRTLDAALAAYPVAGYRKCEGRGRCRGFLTPVWEPARTVTAAAGHPDSCERASLGSLCDCECAGVRHAVITSGGVPSAGRVSERAQRLGRERGGQTTAPPEQTPPRQRESPDWARWRENMARPGVRETVTTRREARGADYRRELAEAEANLTSARERATEALARRRLSKAERARRIDEATAQEQRDVNMARNMVEHVETSTDPVWDEVGHTERTRAQDPDDDNPLAVYGDLLNVVDQDHEETERHLHELEEVPAHFHAVVADNLAEGSYSGPGGIYVGGGDRMTPDLDDLDRLRGEQPRGWPEGSSFDQVAGLYSPYERVVAIGGHARHTGSESTARHELGHALDAAIGEQMGDGGGPASTAPDFRALHDRFRQDPGVHPPYYVQGGDAGPSEMWAEGFAVWAHTDRGMAAPELMNRFNMEAELALDFDRYYTDLDRRIRARVAAR